jgi:hypothetical protein
MQNCKKPPLNAILLLNEEHTPPACDLRRRAANFVKPTEATLSMKMPDAMPFLAMPAMAISVHDQKHENQRPSKKQNDEGWFVMPNLAQKSGNVGTHEAI